MKSLIIVGFFMVMSGFIFSQTATIRNLETGEPIELAILLSDNNKTIVSTDSNGEADITSFQGAVKISIRMLGFKTMTISYTEMEELNFQIFLTPTATLFDEVVVSATRWSQASRNIPSKIAVISARDRALYNPQTAADLLGSSGEVFIQKSQQGGGSPMIRGFSTNRLLYTVDGVRMNSAIFRAGNIQNVISLDPLSIESTEVFFGPGSIIYGSDAIGGVMSFQTLKPEFSISDTPLISGKAASRYSSANNELSHHFNIKVGGEKWASVTGLSYSQFGDLRMGKHGPDEYLKRYYIQRIDNEDKIIENPEPLVQNPTGYSQMNLMQKISFVPTEKLEFHYGFHYSETTEFSRYDRLIEVLPNGLPRSAVWNYGPQIWMMNNLFISHSNAGGVYDRMGIRLAHQYFEESRFDRNFTGGQRFRLRTNIEQVQAYSVNIDFEKILNKHWLYYGTEYVLNDVVSQGSAIDIRDGSDIPVPDRYPQSTWSSLSLYLNYQYHVSNNFLIQAGTRFSAFNIQSDFTRHLQFFPFDFTSSEIQNSATNASLGIVFRPADTWKISMNGSTGFRAPNVDDIGKIFDFVGGEVIVPNTSLKAEYAYNAELGISKVFGDNVKIDVTGFYTYLNNAMVRRTFQVNGQGSIVFNGQLSQVFAIQNAAFGTVYGFNAGIEFKLPAGFSVLSKYNFQLGKEELDNGEISRSRHAAPAFGTTRLSLQIDKLYLQWYAMYSAGVSFANLNEEERQKPAIYAVNPDGNPFSPGWYTLNFKALCQINDHFSLTSGIENLTDQRYRPYSSGLVAPGRNFMISLNVNF